MPGDSQGRKEGPLVIAFALLIIVLSAKSIQVRRFGRTCPGTRSLPLIFHLSKVCPSPLSFLSTRDPRRFARLCFRTSPRHLLIPLETTLHNLSHQPTCTLQNHEKVPFSTGPCRTLDLKVQLCPTHQTSHLRSCLCTKTTPSACRSPFPL